MFTLNFSRAHLSSGCVRGFLLFLTLELLTITVAAQSEKDIQLLGLNNPIERQLAGGQSQSYRIDLSAGQCLHVVVDQHGIDVVVTLFAPDGKQIVEVDSPNGTDGPEPVAAIAEISGSYRLEVRSLEKNAVAGRYLVKIEELRTATVEDKNAIRAEQIFSKAEELRAQGTAEALRGAIKAYEEARPLFHAAGNRDREALTLATIGFLHDSFGEKREALPYFEEALQLFMAVENKEGEVLMLNNIGVLHSTFGDNQKALEYFERALPRQRAINDKYGEAVTRHNIAKLHWNLGNAEKALDYYQQALQLRREVVDKPGETLTLTGIGSVYWVLAEWQKALQYFEDALTQSRTQKDKVAEAAILHNIGGVYRDLGEDREALKYFEQALSLQQTSKDRYAEAITLIAIGLAYHHITEPQKALQYYQQSLPLLAVAGDKRTEGSVLSNIGSAFLDLGDPQNALKYHQQALSLLRESGDKFAEGIALNGIASTYLSLGDKEKALQSFEQSLVLARAVKDKRGEARTLSNLAALWNVDNPSLAVFFGKEAAKAQQSIRSNIRGLDKSVQQTYLRTVIAPYRQLALLLLSQNRLSEAHQILERFRDQEFYDYFSGKNPSVDRATNEFVQIQLTILETRAEQKLQSFLDQAAANPKTETTRLGVLLRELDLNFKEAADGAAAMPTRDTAEMQRTLRELTPQISQRVVAVYTLVGETKFYALIITADGISSVSTAITGKEVNSKARQLWGLLQSDAYDPRVLSHDLYNTVFKPIKEKLPADTKTILWSLDGNLRYLPMGVLYDGKQYLVERYNHVNFTRADSERMTRAPSRQWTGLGLGSSHGHTVEFLGSRLSFGPLPGVDEELRAVFGVDGRSGGVLEGEVLPDDRFTRSSMLAALARRRPVVHIASHFSFRPGDDTRSFLLLGDGSVMTLAEMKEQRDLFAGVELLTLSACNTAAQQPDADGREIDAFAELAQRLGAQAVMATLWPLADDSAPWLMREFYRRRQEGGGMLKAEALRQAQLALLKGSARVSAANNKPRKADAAGVVIVTTDGRGGESQTRAEVVYVEAKNAPPFKRHQKKPFAHPYYWAPVILIGNLR